jgi:hypothetical protein
MYDAIEDPYTYKNSTVLVNKLDLHNQADLNAFEAEISSAKLSITICFKTSITGRDRFVPSG